jgi:phage/plasmid-like protein (TIGR03299 family)
MAHLVQTMAYANETPWHGLGNKLTPKQPLEVWLQQAGMDWSIQSSPVNYLGLDHLRQYNDANVLYRSDTNEALSVVSNRYQVVQPREVLEFYRDLVDLGGFELETAGVLKGGKKLWALARTGQEMLLKGGDLVSAYLLLATACDGTLATTAQFTSVRVVCNNTLALATGDSQGAIKVPHSTKFDANKVKQQLGIGITAWQRFITDAKRLADRPIHPFEARRYLVELLGDPELPFHSQPNSKALTRVFDLFAGAGMGANLVSANDTAWGLLNAVTQFVDHERRARCVDNRLDSAWFGTGAYLKQKALEQALILAA